METEKISEKLSPIINVLSVEELAVFNRIMQNDLLPVIIEDLKECQWKERGSKRKRKDGVALDAVDSDSVSYQNKNKMDYRRHSMPFIVTGISECYRALTNGNIRILVVNKAGKQFYLTDCLVSLCVYRNIPIIPLHSSLTTLSSHLSSTGLEENARVCCYGITKKLLSSRSVNSSLSFLETYYRCTPHVLLSWILPDISTISKEESPTKSVNSIRKNNTRQGHTDRMKSKRRPKFCRCDVMNWYMEKQGKLTWIRNSDLLRRELENSVEDITSDKQIQPISSLPAKSNIISEEDSRIIDSTRNEGKMCNLEENNIEEMKMKTDEQKLIALKSRLRKNPLFKYK